MPSVSPEYAALREKLGEWFATPWRFQDGATQPVYANEQGSGTDPSLDPMWEIRGGFIGDEYLSCRGLAVVVRRGLNERDGTYRADVYEPQDGMDGRLPAPNARAARLFYGTLHAGLERASLNPDAPPHHRLESEQFSTMQLLIRHLNAANRDTVVSWARNYEQLGVHEVIGPDDSPLLAIIRNHLAGPDGASSSAA